MYNTLIALLVLGSFLGAFLGALAALDLNRRLFLRKKRVEFEARSATGRGLRPVRPNVTTKAAEEERQGERGHAVISNAVVSRRVIPKRRGTNI